MSSINLALSVIILVNVTSYKIFGSIHYSTPTGRHFCVCQNHYHTHHHHRHYSHHHEPDLPKSASINEPTFSELGLLLYNSVALLIFSILSLSDGDDVSDLEKFVCKISCLHPKRTTVKAA